MMPSSRTVRDAADPTHPLILRCPRQRASKDRPRIARLAGGSFEATSRHLRMSKRGGMSD
ncbi:hypothetical protein F8B43_4612 [Methylorubrum populi]|uniref:Uncharacterized protein n=1 Tax=Methylorubrum populi TaxID=223967 RepID=A0A833J2C9_9HYPH|nr:hypothetical protein F8B43_4612 [Methylorubrum populi]